jgi:hypothetical protein
MEVLLLNEMCHNLISTLYYKENNNGTVNHNSVFTVI